MIVPFVPAIPLGTIVVVSPHHHHCHINKKKLEKKMDNGRNETKTNRESDSVGLLLSN